MQKNVSEKWALLSTKRFFLTNVPLQIMRKCAVPVPPDHLRSEISSRVLATFQIIGEARKQEAI